MICGSTFLRDRSGYVCTAPLLAASDVEQLNHWIRTFLGKNIIVESVLEKRKTITPGPLKLGGLIEYKWDFQFSWQPFSHAQKWATVRALFTLSKVHNLLKTHGIGQVVKELKAASAKKPYHYPTTKEIDELAAAIDAASILYPKKTFCLPWSATFVLLALRKRWPCRFVIGIQANPFYAHAWADLEGKVINDDPVIGEVLSIILKEPDT